MSKHSKLQKLPCVYAVLFYDVENSDISEPETVGVFSTLEAAKQKVVKCVQYDDRECDEFISEEYILKDIKRNDSWDHWGEGLGDIERWVYEHDNNKFYYITAHCLQ